MSNNGNILTVEEIQLLFQNDGFYECSNPDCGKKETKRNKFKQCSRCQAVKYCSKECQAKHWKAEHKLRCVATTVKQIDGDDDDDDNDNDNGDDDDDGDGDGDDDDNDADKNLIDFASTSQRIEKFRETYGTVLQRFALCALMIECSRSDVNEDKNENKTPILLSKTHVPVIVLEDLPPPAKSPKLSIKGTTIAPVEELPDGVQRCFQDAKRVHETLGTSGFLLITCCQYARSESGIPFTSFFSYAYRETYVGWVRQNTRGLYDKYKNTINCMAAGKAKDLVAAAKRKRTKNENKG